MRALLFSICFLAPVGAHAVGAEDAAPPEPTSTTTACTDGEVWDDANKTCAAPKESSLGDEELYSAAREFAYVGAYDHARAALDAMSNQADDRVLTYRGFTARKKGDLKAAFAHYRAALEMNPDNLLARSYLGQAFVEIGAPDLARAQLTEIRMRGGRMTWAEFALREALRTGAGTAY